MCLSHFEHTPPPSPSSHCGEGDFCGVVMPRHHNAPLFPPLPAGSGARGEGVKEHSQL
jgi:hypothetical protein